MPADQLLTIQRTNATLGAVSIAVAGLLWGGRGMLAAGAGAALSVANFYTLRRLGARAVEKVADGTSTPQALVLVAGLVVKMVLLFGLVWFAVRRLGLPVVPFTLGLSAFVASILLAGFQMGVAPGAAGKSSTDRAS